MTKKKLDNEKQWVLFYVIRNERYSKSELSGIELKGELNSLWFHHILPKSVYPELRFCPDNIILVTSDEHAEIEAGKEFEEVEKRKQELKNNYAKYVSNTRYYLDTFLNQIYEHSKKHTTFFKKH